jgi:hypothetical protein
MPPKSRSEALLAELRREAQERLQAGGGGGIGAGTSAATTATMARPLDSSHQWMTAVSDADAAAGSRDRPAVKRPRCDDEEDREEQLRPAPAPPARKGGRWDADEYDDDVEEAAPPLQNQPQPPPPLQAGRPPAPPPPPPSASERAMAEAAAFKAMMRQ